MKVKISGKSFELPRATAEWKATARPGSWLILERERPDGSIERKRVMARQTGTQFWLHQDGQTAYGDWERGRTASSSQSAANDLTAQFPGKVRKILVKAGSIVAEGEALMLIEAMKMEFSVKAPSAGKIKTIPVKEGEQLSPGTLLVDFEPIAATGTKK